MVASPAGAVVVLVSVVVVVALVSPAGVVVALVSVVVVVVLLSVVVPPPQAATDATRARLASDKAIVLTLIVIRLIRLLLRLLVCLIYRFFSICQDATCNKSTHMKRPQLYKQFEWAQTSWHENYSDTNGITT